MKTDWTYHDVNCAECGADLLRRLFRPKDGKRIERFFCDTACKGAWQKKQHPVSNDWLRARYIDDGMSAVDIARLVGRDPKSVWNWLKHAGIETRPRGADARQHFKPGTKLFLGKKHTAETREAIRQLRKRDGHFPKNKSGAPYWSGVKGEKHPSWKGGATPERAAFYGSQEWKKAVRAVWHKADAKCERCGLDSRALTDKTQKFHIHHIVPFSKDRAKRADPSNLVLLCAPCHRFVHSKENESRQFLEPLEKKEAAK